MKQKFTAYSYWIPILIYIIYLFQNVIDAPFLDDYHVFLRSGREILESDSFFDTFKILTRRQQYEHRLFLNKAFAGLSVLIFGKINFVHVVILGNALLIGLFLYLINRPSILLAAWQKLFLAFILFTPQHWHDSLIWGTCILQHTPTNLCLFGAFIFATKNDFKSLIISLILLTIGAFTSSHGIIGFPLVLAIFIILNNYKNALVFAIMSLPIISFYFYKGDYGHPVADFSAPLLQDLGLKLKTFLIFVGNFSYFLPAAIFRPLNNSFLVPTIAGLLLLIGYILLFISHIKRIFYEKNADLIALHALAISLLGTMFLGCFARGFQGFEMGVIDRYSIYSLTFLVVFFILFFQRLAIANPVFKIVTFCASIVYFYLAYDFYNAKFQIDLQASKTDANNLKYNGKAFLRSFSDSTDYWKPEMKAQITNYPTNLAIDNDAVFQNVNLSKNTDSLQFNDDGWLNIELDAQKEKLSQNEILVLKSLEKVRPMCYFLPIPSANYQSQWHFLRRVPQSTLRFIPVKNTWIQKGVYGLFRYDLEAKTIKHLSLVSNLNLK